MRKLTKIDYRAYVELDTGTTLQVVENGANAGSSILSDFWLFVVITGLTLPVQLYLIQTYDFGLFLVVMGGYGALFAVAQILMKVSKATMEKVVSRKEELSNRFARGIMEMVNLRIQRQFPAEVERVDSLSRDVAQSEGRIRLVNELFFTGFALLVFAVEIIVIARQAALITNGVSTVGILVALVMLVRSVFAPVSGFSFAYVMYKMNKIPWNRFEQFLEKPDDSYLAHRKDMSAGVGENLYRGHRKTTFRRMLTDVRTNTIGFFAFPRCLTAVYRGALYYLIKKQRQFFRHCYHYIMVGIHLIILPSRRIVGHFALFIWIL